MKHVFLYAIAIAAFLVGVAVILANIRTLTVHHMVFAAACFAGAALLGAPADSKTAITTIAPYLPWRKPTP